VCIERAKGQLQSMIVTVQQGYIYTRRIAFPRAHIVLLQWAKGVVGCLQEFLDVPIAFVTPLVFHVLFFMQQ
jgi:hypothetical protein